MMKSYKAINCTGTNKHITTKRKGYPMTSRPQLRKRYKNTHTKHNQTDPSSNV